MKAFLLTFLILGAVFASEPDSTNFNDVMNVIKGVLAELNQKQDIKNVCDCVNEVPELVTKVENFIEELKNVKWTDLEKVFDVFIVFFDAMKEVFISLKPCVKIPGDFENIIKKIGQIDFDKLLKRILEHSFQIFTWVTDAIRDLENKEFYDFGKGIGRILYLFLLDDTFTH